MSDHYHPWLEAQGHSAFTWSLLSAIATKTERIGLATGVTCPSVRYHPAIIAQAAATLAIISDGRFTLGAGAGERLNEHVVGPGSPAGASAMSGSARPWRSSGCCGGAATAPTRASTCSLKTPGCSTCPSELPVIAVAASGPESAQIAADLGDGLFATEPTPTWCDAGTRPGGDGPAYAELPLAWAPDEDTAVQAVLEKSSVRADRLEGHGRAAQPG